MVVSTIDTKAPALSSQVVTSGSLDDITVSSFALYSNNVSGMPSGFTNSYAFVRTTMYDYTTGMQELFAQSGSVAGTAYVRTKSSNTWTAWKQITNT